MIKINTPPFAKTLLLVPSLTVGLLFSGLALAAVDAETAARLKNDLTPFGAERAGNADGTIPDWTGEVVKAELAANGGRIDPFASEQRLLRITASNYKQYKDKLTDGHVALFEKYPETFHMDVYPTHRTHAAPQYVYDNTYENAVRTEVNATGLGVINAYAGIPFPIPKSGTEVIWNHLLRWVGEGAYKKYISLSVLGNGSLSEGGGELWETYPYYKKGGKAGDFKGNLMELMLLYDRPVRRKGEVLLVHDPIDQAAIPRQAWQYVPGQRRVRRAPTVAFDTPNALFNGQATYDDAFMFNGSIERYDWKMKGKKEIYIPYNNNKLIQALSEGDSKVKEIATPNFPNPDYVRWELHRVWEVEANLKDGKRHIYGKRRFYLDEDSWAVAATDIYDGRDELWRVGFASMLNAYDLPGTLIRGTWHTDLQDGSYAFNEIDISPIKLYEGEESGFYTPSNVRQLSRR